MEQKIGIIIIVFMFLLSTGCTLLGGARVETSEYSVSQGDIAAEGCAALIEVDSKILSGAELAQVAKGCLNKVAAPKPPKIQ